MTRGAGRLSGRRPPGGPPQCCERNWACSSAAAADVRRGARAGGLIHALRSPLGAACGRTGCKSHSPSPAGPGRRPTRAGEALQHAASNGACRGGRRGGCRRSGPSCPPVPPHALFPHARARLVVCPRHAQHRSVHPGPSVPRRLKHKSVPPRRAQDAAPRPGRAATTFGQQGSTHFQAGRALAAGARSFPAAPWARRAWSRPGSRSGPSQGCVPSPAIAGGGRGGLCRRVGGSSAQRQHHAA